MEEIEVVLELEKMNGCFHSICSEIVLLYPFQGAERYWLGSSEVLLEFSAVVGLLQINNDRITRKYNLREDGGTKTQARSLAILVYQDRFASLDKLITTQLRKWTSVAESCPFTSHPSWEDTNPPSLWPACRCRILIH